MDPVFSSAEREIDILACSALFLAEDRGILRVLAEKGRAGVNIRIALADPESSHISQRGHEDVGHTMHARIRKALRLYRSVAEPENVEIRLHRAALYNSIYRADDQMLVNQHAYDVPAAQAPVFRLHTTGTGEMTALYHHSFERVWSCAAPLAQDGLSRLDQP